MHKFAANCKRFIHASCEFYVKMRFFFGGIAMVRKRRTVFWLGVIIAAIIYALLCASLRGITSRLVSGGTFVILLVIWSAYYYRLKYTVTGNILMITSGIIFRRKHLIPLDKVLWETRIFIFPDTSAAAVILHTAGRSAVVFGDFSTESG